jgi:hypothetical protein
MANGPQPAFFSWQQPLAMLGAGIAAASSPGGWSNFGPAVSQAGRDWRTMEIERERFDLLRQQADRQRQQFEAEQRRANQEAETRAATQKQIAAMFGGAGSIGTASGAPGQPAMFSGGQMPVTPHGNYGAATGGAPQAAMLGKRSDGSPVSFSDVQNGGMGSPTLQGAGAQSDTGGGADLPFGFTQDQAQLFMTLPFEQQMQIMIERGFAKPDELKPAPTRDILRDGMRVNQEMAPDGSWHDIGQGPQFAPPAQTNINMPGNPTPDEIGRTEFAKQNAAAQAKYFDNVATAGAQAQVRMGDINQLVTLIETTPQGAGQEWMNKGAAVLNRFGVDTTEFANVPAAQAFQSIVSRIAPTLRVAGSGATSDFEMQRFLASLPAIGNMPGGNRIIANNLKKISERSVQEANIAAQVQGGELTPSEGRKKILALGPLDLDLPTFSGPPVGGPGGAPGSALGGTAQPMQPLADDPLNLFQPQP